jgi:hypothetical protein
MIIPRDEAEAKKFEEIVKTNEEAGDWVSDDTSFSPLQVPKKALAILKRVGTHRLSSRK